MNEQKLIITKDVQLKKVLLFLGLTFLLSWGLCFFVFQEGKKLDPERPAILQYTRIVSKDAEAVQRYLDVHPDLSEEDLPLTMDGAAGPVPLNTIEEKVAFYVARKHMAVQSFGIMMIFPALAAVFVRLVTKEKLRNTKTFFGKGKNYIIMLGFLLVFVTLSVLANSLIFGQKPDWMLEQSTFMTHSIAGQSTAPALFWIFQVVVVGIIANITFPIVMMWGEEYGWRSFLLKHLLPKGFFKGSLITNAIWGIWHAPVILMGYNYGVFTGWGVILFTAYCILLGTIFNYMYVRSRSIVLTSAAHGWHNGLVPTVLLLTGHMGPETLIAPIGITGIILMAVAVWIFARRTDNFNISDYVVLEEGE